MEGKYENSKRILTGQREGRGRLVEMNIASRGSLQWQMYKDLCFRMCVSCLNDTSWCVCVWDCIEYVLNVCMLNVCCMLFVCWNTFVWVSPFTWPSISIKGWKRPFFGVLLRRKNERVKHITLFKHSVGTKGKDSIWSLSASHEGQTLFIGVRGHTHEHTAFLHPFSHIHTNSFTHMPAPSIQSHT